jgi:hypothetical protein
MGNSKTLVTGLAFGPTVGIQIPAGRFFVEFSADLFAQPYGDGSVDGVTDPGTALSGRRVVPRVTIAIPIGG